MSLHEILEDQNPWWRDGAIRRARGYPVRREAQGRIISRIGRLDDRRATLLLGPRQVGKTVLLLQTADDLLESGWPPQSLTYFDFSDDRLTQPVTPREVTEARPVGLSDDHPRTFLFDEIRLAPAWDRWLKQAVDQGGNRIVATDSAASLLREGARESGQGRWDELLLESLSFREFARLHTDPQGDAEVILRRIPNLHERYLRLGGFPEHAQSEDYPEVRRRLRSDIAERAILRDLAGSGVEIQRVKSLFVYLVEDSGSVFDATARARDLDADPRSVRDWLRLLTDTLLLVPLERWTRQPSAKLRAKPKIFAADPALVSAFSTAPVDDRKTRPSLFEAAVFRHLRDAARELSGELSFFRLDDDLEIDFVLQTPSRLVGVEVTSSNRVRPEKLDRLRKAGGALGADHLVLVHGGLLAEHRAGVQTIPLARFLLDPIVALEREQP